MTQYSVAEAKNNLPRLIDRMLEGEEVVISRRGKVIARLAPIVERERGRPIDVAWLDARRVRPRGGPIDTVAALKEMKDESPR